MADAGVIDLDAGIVVEKRGRDRPHGSKNKPKGASNRQVHLLIQACQDQSKGWWMRLKSYGPKGYLVSIDFSSCCWLEAKKPSNSLLQCPSSPRSAPIDEG
jgi:hypothetical protein